MSATNAEQLRWLECSDGAYAHTLSGSFRVFPAYVCSGTWYGEYIPNNRTPFTISTMASSAEEAKTSCQDYFDRTLSDTEVTT